MSFLHTPRKGALGGEGSAVDMARCRVSVQENSRWPSFHQCWKAVAVTVDGIGYCNTHSPKAEATRDKAREDRYRAKEEQAKQRRVSWGLKDATTEQLRAELARREAKP